MTESSFTLWYPRNKIQTRLAIFWGGATFAGAFSGLLAFGISFMSGTGGLLGWSWIFVRTLGFGGNISLIPRQIIEGLFTVVVGFVALFSKSRVLRSVTEVLTHSINSPRRPSRNGYVPHD